MVLETTLGRSRERTGCGNHSLEKVPRGIWFLRKIDPLGIQRKVVDEIQCHEHLLRRRAVPLIAVRIRQLKFPHTGNTLKGAKE